MYSANICNFPKIHKYLQSTLHVDVPTNRDSRYLMSPDNCTITLYNTPYRYPRNEVTGLSGGFRTIDSRVEAVHWPSCTNVSQPRGRRGTRTCCTRETNRSNRVCLVNALIFDLAGCIRTNSSCEIRRANGEWAVSYYAIKMFLEYDLYEAFRSQRWTTL